MWNVPLKDEDEGDLSVKHLGGVRSRAPSAGSWVGSGDHCGEDLRQMQHPGKTAFSAELSRFFMACPGKCFPKELILQPSDFAKSLVFKRDFDFLKMFTAVVCSGPSRRPHHRQPASPTAAPGRAGHPGGR